MMTRASRIVVLVASLALALVYLLPIWVIDLEAPQYPEGLGMVIRIDDVGGQKPNDLNNINNLNHYIGMKRIEPESIPELRIMPWLVALLMAGGIATAAVGRRRLLYAWIGAYLAISIVGLADFYKWEYDYGHNLDEENAIIKVPGMNYQPPLIGSKRLLNFTAHSWPGSGGWILIGTALVGIGVAAVERRRGRGEAVPPSDAGRPDASAGDPTPSRGGSAALPSVVVALVALGAAGCGGPAPRPLQAGVDTCARCLMNVADDGSGAEVVTATGLVHTFDSIECMAAWLDHDGSDVEVHSLWVTDRGGVGEAGAGRLIRADEALFLAGSRLASPMGLGLSAWASADARADAAAQHDGTALDWEGVRAWVRERWPEGRPPMAGMGQAATGGHGGHAQELRP